MTELVNILPDNEPGLWIPADNDELLPWRLWLLVRGTARRVAPELVSYVEELRPRLRSEERFFGVYLEGGGEAPFARRRA